MLSTWWRMPSARHAAPACCSIPQSPTVRCDRRFAEVRLSRACCCWIALSMCRMHEPIRPHNSHAKLLNAMDYSWRLFAGLPQTWSFGANVNIRALYWAMRKNIAHLPCRYRLPVLIVGLPLAMPSGPADNAQLTAILLRRACAGTGTCIGALTKAAQLHSLSATRPRRRQIHPLPGRCPCPCEAIPMAAMQAALAEVAACHCPLKPCFVTDLPLGGRV